VGFDHILAQAPAIETLQRALSRDRLAHAYLFEGPSGVGKQKVALALACALLCPEQPKQGCGVCAVCTRVLEGKHPDVRVFAPRDEGNRNIQVELVREEILPFAKFAPFEANAACLIFPEADVSFPVHHAEAANTLLKTLEEPRARITFLLLSERPDRLLSTIRSRCQPVRFGPLPKPVLREILKQQAVDAATIETACGLAFGSADRALSLAQDGLAEQLLEFALRVDEAVQARKPGTLLDLADELASHDHRDLLLDTLSLFYRDVASRAILGDGAELAFPQQSELIQQRAAALGGGRAAERQRAIAVTREAMERNANPETALDALFFSFA
jgi:DNA polymerase-3 subunit delta'